MFFCISVLLPMILHDNTGRKRDNFFTFKNPKAGVTSHVGPLAGGGGGGVPCLMSNLRNDNVACRFLFMSSVACH